MRIINLTRISEPQSFDRDGAIRTVLEAGGVIVYPTDTLYGLGVDATSEKAVKRLYALKRRKDSPVSVLLSDVEQLFEMTKELSDKAVVLIKKFMPGAITVICKSGYPFAPQLSSPTGTIGFRVPGDEISRQIPAILGKPITTTSVNPAGQEPAASLKQILNYYPTEVEIILDRGTLKTSKGSTVIDLSVSPFKILREGEISRQALKDFLN